MKRLTFEEWCVVLTIVGLGVILSAFGGKWWHDAYVMGGLCHKEGFHLICK